MAGHDVDKTVDEAEGGTAAAKAKAACAKSAAKVARQPKGSARRRIAERALKACRDAQSTDSNQ